MSVKAPARLARETLYTSPWVNLHVDRVEFPGDRIIERHHFLEFPSKSVGVLVENEANHLLLVEAYRYVTGTVEWEIPAGHIDGGETVLAAAEREVSEEGGYATAGHRLVYSFYPIPGIGDALHHVVYCRSVGQVGTLTGPKCGQCAGFRAANCRRCWKPKHCTMVTR
ncbi:MAG: NUDIX hydrolase [Anaerolineales bacterium]|nr:NUDIX hydrolase [Anaerolineales bacterium]